MPFGLALSPIGWSVDGVGRWSLLLLWEVVERMLGGRRLGLPGGIIEADRMRECEWPLCTDEGRGELTDFVEGDLYGTGMEDMFGMGKGD